MILRRQSHERIDYRRSIENNHQHDIPYHSQVPKFHIQRGGDKRKGKNDDIDKKRKKQEHSNCRQAWHKSFEREKEGDNQKIHQEYQSGVDGRSQNDRPARDIDFGHQLGFGNQRCHPGARALCKKIIHHKRNQKLQRIGVHSGATRIENGRKDEIQNRESQKGLEKRPKITQNASVIAELEISLGKHPDQFFVVFV